MSKTPWYPIDSVLTEAETIWNSGNVVLPLYNPKGTGEEMRTMLELWIGRVERVLLIIALEGKNSSKIININLHVSNVKKRLKTLPSSDGLAQRLREMGRGQDVLLIGHDF